MLARLIRGLFQYVKSNSLRTGALRCCLLVLLLVSAGTAVARTASVFETPPTLRAQDLAPATLPSN